MIELWNRHGKRVVPYGQLDYLVFSALPDFITPGTALDAVWVRDTETLIIQDITHYGVTKNRYKALAELARPLDSSDSDLPWEPWQSARLKLVPKIDFYWPPIPVVISTPLLMLPPDDWRMELKPKGDRLLIISQPRSIHQSMDMRAISLDLRVNVLTRLVRTFGTSDIQMVSSEESAFYPAYEDWRHHPYSEGVIMRRRNSSYKASTKKTIQNKNWLMMRFKRSPRS